jgi:hypothetical protein
VKLYASAAGPRRADFYRDTPTPASAYARQQHLLEAYTEVLYTWWDPEALYLACFGDLAARPTKSGTPPTARAITKRIQAAEDRLGYEVPELIERLTPEELEAAATVFCEQTLAHFILHILGQERTVQHRLQDGNCSTRLSDDSHAKAAGLGKARPKAAVKPTVQRAPVPVITQKTSARPALRVQKHSPRYWSRVRKHSQLSIWPPVTQAFGAGELAGAL